MPTLKKRVNFEATEEGIAVRTALSTIDADSRFNTESSYSANSTMYPNNLIPFVEKHMKYLHEHPAINPHDYLANIRLMTRLR